MSRQRSSNVTIIERTTKSFSVDYQLLVVERDNLLEAEIGYKKHIEDLEKESAETLRSFDILYNENKILRSKLDTPVDNLAVSAESYNDVYKDREHLKEANRAYKRKIQQLENDLASEQNRYSELYSKHQLVAQKAHLETVFATKAKDDKINDLEKERSDLQERLKMLLQESEVLKHRMAEMNEEENELKHKYVVIEEANLEFQARCDILQEDREKLKQKVADLETKIPDPGIKAKEEQQFLELQNKVLALQETNTDATKEIYKLNEDIRTLKILKREKVEMVDRALSVIIDEEREATRMDADRVILNNTTLELEDMKKRLYRVINENQRLEEVVTSLKNNLADSETAIKDLKKDLDIRSAQIEELSVTVNGAKQLEEEYLAMTEINRTLSTKNQALENELVKEKKVSKLKILELENSLGTAYRNLDENKKAKEKIVEENQKIGEENNYQGKVIEAQTIELRNMKAHLEQIQVMLEEKSLKYDEMKKAEKKTQEQLRESGISLHVTRHELESLKKEKAGHFHLLKKEMENATMERKEESEQMREETLRLQIEVKKLKDYEYKISTMDAEIRRLMNRLRMSERFRKIVKKSDRQENNGEEIRAIKRKLKEMEKENNQLTQEKHQSQILKKKYEDLQKNNRRLAEENGRVREKLDESIFQIGTLEKRIQKINATSNGIQSPSEFAKATYIAKPSPKSEKQVALVKDRVSSYPVPGTVVGVSNKRGIKPNKSSRSIASEKKTTSTSASRHKGTSKLKKSVLPTLRNGTSDLQFGRSYREIHSNHDGKNVHLSLL